jgi:outer membrane cobalamin receptor
MRHILPLMALLFLFSARNAYAQNSSGKITGSIKDGNGKAIEAATISLLKAKDSSLVKVALSGKTGIYEFEKIPYGIYVVSASVAGFEKSVVNGIKLGAGRADFTVEPIQLKPSVKTLGEVTVVGKKPLIENKIDRMVINVDAAPSNAGQSAMEVLEKSPGVSVSNEGVISLKGKQGVIVMMDGKPTYLSPADLASVLKNLPASAVEQIEIMTNPSSKYDASGNSGLINIKTKKNRNDGFNGSISQGVTVGWFSRDKTTYAPFRNSTSVNLNYRKGKLNLFGNYNFNYREGKGDLYIERSFYEKDGLLNSTSSSHTAFNGRNNNHTVKLGMDFYANKKNVFGIVLTGFGFFGRPEPESDQLIRRPDGSVESILKTNIINDIAFYNYSANLNFKHSFDTAGREITADVDYIGYTNNNKTLLTTHIYDGNMDKKGSLILDGKIPGNINIYSFKTDYDHPLKNDMRLEAGFKASFVKNDNEVKYQRWQNEEWMLDARSNHFIYEENIQAAYLNLNKKWKKFSAQGGLRLENTVAKGKQVTTDSLFERKYTSLFSTMYVNYDFNKKHSLKFTYGRRIERPNYRDLNPFLWFLDSLTFRQGNPYLLPQFAHNFEFSHTFKQQWITTLNYSITDDVISELLKQNTEKRITFLTVENVARFRNIGLSITAPINTRKR